MKEWLQSQGWDEELWVAVWVVAVVALSLLVADVREPHQALAAVPWGTGRDDHRWLASEFGRSVGS